MQLVGGPNRFRSKLLPMSASYNHSKRLIRAVPLASICRIAAGKEARRLASGIVPFLARKLKQIQPY